MLAIAFARTGQSEYYSFSRYTAPVKVDIRLARDVNQISREVRRKGGHPLWIEGRHKFIFPRAD